MKKEHVSNAVIRRLPRYFRHLTDLHDAGVVRVSSSALGKSLGVTASQIRQDLSCFGEFGQQGYGYNVEALRNEIADILGINNRRTAIVLGAGNLGRALLENFHFSRSGFDLTAAFDINPAIVGTTIGSVPVYHMDGLEDYLAGEMADVVVLTVPQRVTLEVADRLVKAGVRAIWNFTNIELNITEPGVIVEDVHFADSLLALSYMISVRDKGN